MGRRTTVAATTAPFGMAAATAPAYAHGGGYWRGGVWWPFAAVGAVVGTAAAIVAAPFVAFGNAVASAPYYAPQPVLRSAGYRPQYYAPQGYIRATAQLLCRRSIAHASTSSITRLRATTRSLHTATRRLRPTIQNNRRSTTTMRGQEGYAPPPQRSYSPPATYNAPPSYPPGTTTYQRPRDPAPAYYSYNYPR